EWLGCVAVNYVHFDNGRVAHPCYFEVGKGTLLRSAVEERDLAFECGRNAPNDSTFHLLLNADWVDDAAAIDCRYHALDTDIAIVIDRDVGDVGNIGMPKVSIAGYAATASFRDRFAPARLIAHNFENTGEATAIDCDRSRFDGVGAFEQVETKGERIGTAMVCDFVQEPFAGKHTRRCEDGAPRPV